MSDLISREQAIVQVCKQIWDDAVAYDVKEVLKELPSALTTGKWIICEVASDEDDQPIAWECDACGAVVDCKTKFCPECGQEKEV